MIHSMNLSLQKRLHWILRISASACYIGHGAWGLITKSGWVPYFSVAGIPESTAYKLMPLVGLHDIALGILILFIPMRAAYLWMGIWAVWTALCRPLACVPTEAGFWEVLERGGNYGVPFTILAIAGLGSTWKEWFIRIKEPVLTRARAIPVDWFLRVFIALLVIGHGGFLAFKHKPMLIAHYHSIGLPLGDMDPVLFVTLIGWFEILLGLSVLVKPIRSVVLFIFFWKLGTELLYITHNPVSWDFFEFIERAGSYGAPLALYYLLRDWNSLPETET